jgi:hypothetical protein
MDGIDGHTDEVTGKETRKSSLFRGTRIRFGKTSEWEIKGDNEVIPPERHFIFRVSPASSPGGAGIVFRSKPWCSSPEKSGPITKRGTKRSRAASGSKG